MGLTTDRNDPRLGHGVDAEPIPQHEVYLVLSEEERAKGFVRPVRKSYQHVGKFVDKKGKIVSLEIGLEGCSDWAKQYYSKENGYVAFLQYPDSESPLTGKYITQEELDSFNSHKENSGGCGTVTTMGLALAETYARDPNFYGATYCCGCMKHLPVEEFIWDGTKERVGS